MWERVNSDEIFKIRLGNSKINSAQFIQSSVTDTPQTEWFINNRDLFLTVLEARSLRLGASIIDAFELWCWRILFRVPWTARRSNQSILKEISPWISLEGMMLKLKLQYFGHLMRRVDSLENTLKLGGIGGRRRRGRQRMRWLDGITDSMDMSLSELRELWWTRRPGVLWFMGSQRVGHDWATELNCTPLPC